MLWFLIPSFGEVEGVWMLKVDHKICYYTKWWFNECSIRGAADLTSFLASLLVCLFLVSLNNKIYKLECVCHSWIGLQISQVAEDSSTNREWTSWSNMMMMMMVIGSLIILSCPNQVTWLQLFVCSPFPSSFNGSIKSTYAICMDGLCSSCLHQARLVTYYMINSTLGDFTEIHVFELWSCGYVLDWWK